ncbi:hypothetical protein DY138_02785 [Apilactobacillus timberlakei]|uniref:hypothetical protein n=1 Tax=Apilactobacillus timberlakei TaxID=2008380 RepID=UPI00112E225A|nr:hypothetical protein [Apilactobacillus timberlakei]TPR19587.1 hypothetical protein DY138_02785 [Apilactobacillus timberlakei]
MHPNDDMSNLMRFKLFQGSAVVSQLVDMAIPAVFVLICFMFTHSVSALGVGTIISLFCNAFLIKYADKYVFPSLVHNFNKSDNM